MYSPADLSELQPAAEAAAREFLAGNLAQQQSWSTMGPAYIALAALAERYTLLEPAALGPHPAAAQVAAQNIFRNVIADPARRADLATVAARWLQHERRQNQGVVLVGVVESASPLGKWTELTVGVPLGDDRVSTRLLAKDHGFRKGDDIAAVGAIFDQPQQQIPGYQGEAPSLILASWTFTPVAAAERRQEPSPDATP
jgi:hypothetical protein